MLSLIELVFRHAYHKKERPFGPEMITSLERSHRMKVHATSHSLPKNTLPKNTHVDTLAIDTLNTNRSCFRTKSQLLASDLPDELATMDALASVMEWSSDTYPSTR